MKPLMVSGFFPCVRAGKITEALREEHDVLSRVWPPQFQHVYDRKYVLKNATVKDYCDWFSAHDGEYDIIHVHNEPNWPVIAAKESQSAPVLMNVHDVTSARPAISYDPYESLAFDAADAFVFISEEQRQFTIDLGFAVEGKPYCVLANYASESTIVDKRVLPYVGGVVYVGGLDKRGMEGSWRDLSPVADAMEAASIPFHIYPGNPGIDYGITHRSLMEYGVITHRMSQHDWGFSGTPVPNHAWAHAYPNKVFEYLAAGIPFIALNSPLVKPLCDQGLGYYLPDIAHVKDIPKLDRKGYTKRVRANRHRFTMGYNIKPLQDLYATLRGQ